MSTAQTNAETLPALKDQLAVLETQRQVVAVKNEIDRLMKEAEYSNVVLMEAYGDRVDPQEYLTDDPSFGLGGRYINPISRPDDRADGRYRPVFENEIDLSMIRGSARILSTSTGSGLNILGNLTNYTVGTGFTYEAKPVKGTSPPDGLVDAVQKVIDTFMTDNDWQSDLEREVHWRSREDGETPIVLRPRGWQTEASIVEPDNITQPTDTRGLEEWLARVGSQIGSRVAGDFVSSWSFGVHTRANDTAHPLGFNAVFTGEQDWDYYPADDVPLAKRLGSGVMEFIKRNTPMNVKRGISDFYPVMATLERAEKLSKNIQVTAAIQAAIAFIRNHPKTATQPQIQSLQSGNSTGSVNRPAGSGGTRSISRQKFESGTIIDTNGSEYHAGPMGQSSAPTYIDVLQAAWRAGGARWCMPEYMISSDASNNNFASILVSGSPFVKARESDQAFDASRYKRMMWKVVRIAFEGGYFQQFSGLVWEVLESMIDIVATPPDITIADDLKNAQIKEAERAAGVLSLKTWRKESGRDHEEEERNIAEERANGTIPASEGTVAGVSGSGTSPLADGANADGGIDVAGLALNGAQTASLTSIIKDAAAGSLPLGSVKPTIQVSFPTMPEDKIDQIVASLTNFTPTADANGNPINQGKQSSQGGSAGGTGGGGAESTITPGGEFGNLSTLQWNRNIKAIDKALREMVEGKRSELMTEQMLVSLGLNSERAKAFIKDAKDNGKVDDPEFVAAAAQESLSTYYKLPNGLSMLHESAYVAALETATPEEKTQLLAKAWETWESYP